MTVRDRLSELEVLFSIFDNPKDKFVQLMDMAKDLDPLAENEKIKKNQIYGCSSQAWVVVKKNLNATYSLQIDSDALIVKGLLVILQKIFEKQTADEILSVKPNDILQSLGLDGIVTTQRTNGFSSALEKIQRVVN